ncbi:MAG: lipase maturation factor family protein [Terracidiphilus sp.]
MIASNSIFADHHLLWGSTPGQAEGGVETYHLWPDLARRPNGNELPNLVDFRGRDVDAALRPVHLAHFATSDDDSVMERTPCNIIRRLFDSRLGLQDRLVPRWLFLRALAAIYFSAFYSLLFQIKGLNGPEGILPAQQYLAAVNNSLSGMARYWYAPSLFWISSSSHALMVVTWIGLAASVAAFLNLWPRASFFVCFACFLSFVSAASDFSNYQSDGMLLEAGFLALFFVPSGLMPGWGTDSPPSRASLFLLQWEWFRIYFESGMVKLLSGDTEWRNLTAMDEYYQNGPLPTWIGWYVQHFPHWFHVASAAGTLVMELGVVLMLFFPRRVRLICFFIVTPWEIGVILTANYTFLNYLVLSLGFLLLDDRALIRFVPKRFRPPTPSPTVEAGISAEPPLSILAANQVSPATNEAPEVARETPRPPLPRTLRQRLAGHIRAISLAVATVMLTWIAYDTTAEMISMLLRGIPLPNLPIAALEPLRIANQYGLFAVMTRGRYEIEFQGSDDGNQWVAYPFKYKPQALNEVPGIYAPYQPRFDWNLWFASLGGWRQNDIVPLTEERLLGNDADVLALFKSNPFAKSPPRYVRAVLWQYWFTSMDEKRSTGNWWRRNLLGLYAPEITLTQDGKAAVVQMPEELPPHD